MFEEIISKLNKAEKVGIFVHVNPDGDALGSAYSLKNVLKERKKEGDVFLCGSVEPCLKDIFSVNDLNFEKEINKETINNEYDMLIALDCADIKRLGEYAEVFVNHKNTAALDHHITHEVYAKTTVVKEISSTCELIFNMYKEAGYDISLKTAEYLYVGIATDTGSFKFSSVDGDTHRAAAELMDIGVDVAGLSKKIFDTKSPNYLKLYAYAINSTSFYADGKIAVLKLSEEDFENFGISEAAASAIVSLPGQIEGVKMGVYVRNRTKECKISLRSSGEVDVSALASAFGGGGHKQAAGYSVNPQDVEQNLKQLILAVSDNI